MRKKQQPTIEYNLVNDPKYMHGYRTVRWVENAPLGLRRIGFADEVTEIAHRGWFIRDDEGMSDEVYRGVVYQLPARHGKVQYVYGYDDPNNDGAALLCFDLVDDKHDAARQADRFAEIMAEHEREYDRAWQAGRRYEDLDEEIKEMRNEALQLAEEMRAVRRGGRYPSTVATLREKIASLYQQICKARKEREELRDNYGNCEGWKE